MIRQFDRMTWRGSIVEGVVKPSMSGAITNDSLVLLKEQLPLTIIYNGRRYVLVLTKQDKLLLNKAISSSAS